MALQPSSKEPAQQRAPLSAGRIALVAVPVVLVLFALYWFVLRTTYEPILTSVEPDEAAEIVKVLKERKIDYRLGDGGRAILVASGQADQARLELVGSELPIRGQVGFELFNQSDMGLTEFAQKINYQRALQGELARTILLLKGIRSVRVHLGLPERSLFRDEQSQPKASVTLILEPGTSMTESRISGIQQMVAGAIPEMAPAAVAVLDGTGKVVSRKMVADPAPFANSDAIIENYQRRASSAIVRALPSLRFALNVSLRPRSAPVVASDTPTTAPVPRGDPDYAINLRITTPAPLDDSARLELVDALRENTGFDSLRGDAIVFLVGDPPLTEAVAPPATDRIVTNAPSLPGNNRAPLTTGIWVSLALGLLAIAGGAALWLGRRRERPDETQALASFTQQLRQRLAGQTGESL
jgi:flagellar M-ring protein FliF